MHGVSIYCDLHEKLDPQTTLSPIRTYEILQVKGSPCIAQLYEFTYNIYQGPICNLTLTKEGEVALGVSNS
jgi:hypothetical protein